METKYIIIIVMSLLVLFSISGVAIYFYTLQETTTKQPETTYPSPRTGTWKCMLGNRQIGDPITVNWADKVKNGDITASTWACNAWKSECGNTAGGCTAV